MSDKDTVSFCADGMESRVEAIAGLFRTRKEAADAAGVAQSSLLRWISGEGMPAFDSLAKLALKAGVSLTWLATGGGDMLAAQNQPSRAMVQDEYAYIPLYDTHVSAGYGAWNEGVQILAHLAFTRYSLRSKGLDPDNLSAVRIVGDSSEPDLNDGDTVLVDHSRTTLRQDGYYVILLNDHLYAKRLQLQFDGGMAIISANPAYQTMMVPKARVPEMLIIGSVVWKGRWLV